jgi:hypothetical protein
MGRALLLVTAIAAIVSLAHAQPPGASGSVHADIPATIDPGARYLFHMHGRAVEVQGPNPRTPLGAYMYPAVLDALAARGFVVISEVRPASTQLLAYASHVATQVEKLIAAGVPADRITVTGFSKGGAITVLSTVAIDNPQVSFVVMAGCLRAAGSGGSLPDGLKALGKRPRGRVLSIYDEGDTEAGSCTGIFTDGAGLAFKEIVLHAGRGHALFFTPETLWLDPATEWAQRR